MDKKKKTFEQQASDFLRGLGFGAVGDLGQGINNAAEGAAQKLIDMGVGGKKGAKVEHKNTFLTPEQEQTWSSPAGAATNVAKDTAGLASWMVPGGKAAAGASTMAKIFRPIAAGAASGALQGAAQDEVTPMSVATSAAGGGATNAVLKGVGAAGKSVAEHTMNNLFREPTKRAVTSAIKKGEQLGTQVMESKGELGKGLTAEQIRNNALKKLGELEDQLQGALKDSGATVSVAELTEKLQPRITELVNAGETEAANALTDRLATWQKIHGDEAPVTQWNKIKRTLYDKINNSFGTQAAEGTENLKEIARAIKEVISEKVPTANEINQTLSQHGRVAEAMVNNMAKSGNVNLKDIVLGAGGFATGGPVGSLVVPMANRALQSPAGQKATAAVADTVGNVANNSGVGKVVGNMGADVTRTMGNLFGGEVGGDNVQNDQPNNDLQDNHDTTIPQSGATIKIRNKKTGEIKEVTQEEATQLGVGGGAQQGGGMMDPKMLQAMMMYDLQTTGGKNIPELNTIFNAQMKQNETTNKKDKPLSAAAQKDLTKANTGLKALDRIQGDLDADSSVVAKKLNPLDQEGRRYGADMTSLIDLIGYFRTGATITPEQRKDYIYMFPSVIDDKATIKRKLDAIKEELQGYQDIKSDVPDMSQMFSGASNGQY